MWTVKFVAYGPILLPSLPLLFASYPYLQWLIVPASGEMYFVVFEVFYWPDVAQKNRQLRPPKPETLHAASICACKKGNLTLSAWHLSGGSGQSWRDYHTSMISGAVIAADHFSGPRPGYNPGDTTLSQIICQL